MTAWENEGLETKRVCDSDVKVVNQLSYVDWIVCLFSLNTFRNICT